MDRRVTKCWEAAAPPTPPPHPARALLMGRTAGRSLQGRALSPALSERRPLPGGAALFCPRQSPGGSVSPGVQARKSCLLCPRWPPSLALRGSGRVPLSQRCEGPGCGRWATLGGPSPLQSRSRTQSNLWAKPPQRWPCHIVLGAREFRKRSAESQAPPSLSPPPPPGASSFGRSQHRALECGSAGWWVLDHCL